MKTTEILSLAVSFYLMGSSVVHAKDKPSTIIKQSVTIDAPINKAWQILGPQFPDAYKWASSVNHSEAKNKQSVNGSTCSESGCNISGMGNIKEKILSYSDTEHIL